MSELTQWEKQKERLASLLRAVEDNPTLINCSRAQRVRLAQFAFDTGMPISSIAYLVLGMGELALTSEPKLGKYELALLFGGAWVKGDDDDLPF